MSTRDISAVGDIDHEWGSDSPTCASYHCGLHQMGLALLLVPLWFVVIPAKCGYIRNGTTYVRQVLMADFRGKACPRAMVHGTRTYLVDKLHKKIWCNLLQMRSNLSQTRCNMSQMRRNLSQMRYNLSHMHAMQPEPMGFNS